MVEQIPDREADERKMLSEFQPGLVTTGTTKSHKSSEIKMLWYHISGISQNLESCGFKTRLDMPLDISHIWFKNQTFPTAKNTKFLKKKG